MKLQYIEDAGVNRPVETVRIKNADSAGSARKEVHDSVDDPTVR